ncbi:MAG TPA: hypothetical protein QGI71_00630 [Dehalococcoidia bacterium]|jgi:hypothetical protein|nr:hypothetical protein [Dehalococcoidia bacterium]
MSSFLRLAVFAGVIFVGFMLLYRPAELRHAGRRLRLVGFAYVAAILIGATLRLLGVYST